MKHKIRFVGLERNWSKETGGSGVNASYEEQTKKVIEEEAKLGYEPIAICYYERDGRYSILFKNEGK